MKLWAVGITRNEADVVRLSVLNLLRQGVDQVLILDNGSTDGTRECLRELARQAAVEWRPHDGHFRQNELATLLVREAFIRGADWVLPFDADEFWCAPGSTIRSVLEASNAGCLEVQVVNFVQRRQQEVNAPDALLTMTRRAGMAVGPIDLNPAFVERRSIAFVEMLYPPKWISRTSPALEVSWGNHSLNGAPQPAQSTEAIVCLHAPLRSKAGLRQKVDGDRPLADIAEYLEQAWHVKRWRRLAEEGCLDQEWAANSYVDNSLDLYGTSRQVVEDLRLRDVVAPLLDLDTAALSSPGGVISRNGASDSTPVAFAAPKRFLSHVSAWGVMVVQESCDAVAISIAHHLSLGLDRLLILDDSSTDVTSDVLAQFEGDPRVEIRRPGRPVDRHRLLAELTREAFGRGATWIVPIEQTRFWSIDGDLREALHECDCGALGAECTGEPQGGVPAPMVRWIFRATPYLVPGLGDDLPCGVASPVRVAPNLRLDRVTDVASASGVCREPPAAGSPGEPDPTRIGDIREALLPMMRETAGWLTDAEADALYRHSLHTSRRFGRGAAIVELGSYCGKSSLMLAGGIAASEVGTALYAVDPHRGEVGAGDSPIGVAIESPTFARFAGNLARAGLAPHVVPVRRYSYEVDWAAPIGLLFIDGLHDRTSVGQDVRLFVDWVLDGGLVAFHDCSDLFPGVQRHVHALEASGEFRRVDSVDDLVVLQRVARHPDTLRERCGWVPARLEWEIVAADASRELRHLQESLANERLKRHDQSALVRALEEQLHQQRTALALSAGHGEQARRRDEIIEAVTARLREERRQAAAATDELRTLRVTLDEYGQTIAARDERIGTLEDHVQTLSASLDAKHARVEELLGSLTWRSTAPLRRIVDLAIGFRQRFNRRQARFELHFTRGALAKALASWREGRFEFSPALWRIHLRNYRRELAWNRPVRAVESSQPAESPAAPGLPVSSEFLVITDAVPTPDKDAGSARLWEIVTLLRRIGFDVTLASDSEERQPDEEAQLEAMGVGVLHGAARVTRHLAERGSVYSYVLLSRPDVAFRYFFPVRSAAIHACIAYDTVDLHWVRLTRAAALSGDAALLARADEYRRMEAFCAASADVVLAVTETEKQLLGEAVPDARIEVIPTIHRVTETKVPWPQRGGLMFIGGFWHAPNVDAVLYFCDRVLPLIRAELPELVFHVIGSHMPDRIRCLDGENIRAVGWVKDPTPYFERCRVFVSPLRYGAGMKGKIGQSMAHGLPVVTTSIGAEGMQLSDGETALVADGDEAFARAVIRLYKDEVLWTSMSRRSLEHVRAHFSEAAARARLEQIFPNICGSAPAAEAVTG